jgi:hypothetical protein
VARIAEAHRAAIVLVATLTRETAQRRDRVTTERVRDRVDWMDRGVLEVLQIIDLSITIAKLHDEPWS